MTQTINSLFLAFINSVSANGYQIVVSASKPVLQQNVVISTIQVDTYLYLFTLNFNIPIFLGSINRIWISR